MNDKSLKVLEWNDILISLKSYAVSDRAKRRCLETPLYNDYSRIQYELGLTAEARSFLDMVLYPPLEEIYDVQEFVQAAQVQKTLNCEEIVQVAKTLKASRVLQAFILKNSKDTPLIEAISQKLFANKELEEDIFSKFNPSGEIKDDATPELRTLNASIKDQEKNLKKKLNELMGRYSNYLQESVYTNREDRYVLPVKVEHKAHVKGIIYDFSASGATVFIEPAEVTTISNIIRETQIKIETEIKRILCELSSLVARESGDILLGLNALTEIDFIFAKAKYSVELKAVAPNLNQDKIIKVKKAKHPILMRVIENTVPNDIWLGESFDHLIITGSNTGGKTVTLKTLGLFVLMVKAGLHLPCIEASIYPFEKVFADIGDEQSVVQSLSTFSGHINNLKEIVDNTNDKTLVLMDEIGAGTDPAEGSALAQAILEYIDNKGAKSVVTTHYGELKTLAFTKERFENASVEFDANTLAPTYKLNIGIPGKSNALDIAKNLGLDEGIISNARNIHFNIKDPTGATLEGLQKIQQQLSDNNKLAQENREQAQAYKNEYQKKLFKINEEKKKALASYKKRFDGDLKVARDEIKAIMKEIYKQKSEKLTRRAATKINKVEQRVREGFSDSEEILSPKYELLDWNTIKVGDSVLIKELNQSAIIVEMPDKNDNVKVQIGLMKTTVKKDGIAKTSKKAAQPKQYKAPRIRREHVSSELSLRGIRVDEALDRLDKYLDDAAMYGLSTICVIHGHGTGALKEAVRSYLKDSPYIKNYRKGADGEGGDGVTIADLK